MNKLFLNLLFSGLLLSFSCALAQDLNTQNFEEITLEEQIEQTVDESTNAKIEEKIEEMEVPPIPEQYETEINSQADINKEDIVENQIPIQNIQREIKITDGYVLENILFDQDWAIIPKGTIIPLSIDTCINAKTSKAGETFILRTPYNFTTKQKEVVIPVGIKLEGQINKIIKPKKFIRNAYVALSTTKAIDLKGYDELNINASLGEKEPDMKIIRNAPYLTRFRYNVIKGQNMYLHKGQRVDFVLLEPLKVKLYDNYESDI